MAKLYTWPPKRDDDWPYCYTPDMDSATAQMLAAMKEGCADDEIEVKRTGGGVLCRRKKATDGQSGTCDHGDGMGAGDSGGLPAAGSAGTGEVTDG